MKNKLIGRAVRLSEIGETKLFKPLQDKLRSKLPLTVYETELKAPFYNNVMLLSFESENSTYENSYHPALFEIESIEEKEVDSDAWNEDYQKGYEQGYKDATGEAAQEIREHYHPNS